MKMMKKFLNHNYFFIFGWGYYLFIPPILGWLGKFHDYPGFHEWYVDFHKLSLSLLFEYYLSIFSLLIFFMLGSFFGGNFRLRIYFPFVKYNRMSIIISGILSLFIVLYLIWSSDVVLFSGYEFYDSNFLGKIATIFIVSCFLSLYFLEKNIGKMAVMPIFASLSICSVVMIGLGARMYVLLLLISFAMYYLKYKNVILNIKYIILMSLMLFLILMVGVVRVGLDLNFENLMYILFAEPMFTWWSAQTYIYSNDITSFSVHLDGYITSFYNFIPSFIFENKSEFIVIISDYANFSSPLGATSLIVSLLGNFGILFSMVFIFFVGFYISQVNYYSYKSSFIKIYYILICSLLPFQFFRDGFEILNKQMYWNMLIVPMFILLGVYLLSFMLNFLKIGKNSS